MTKKIESKERTYKVRNPFNYEPKLGQKFTQLSQTVPDQSIPLKVLLERHVRGLPMDVAVRTPLYESEGEHNDGINPATLDLVDIQDIKTFIEESKKDYDNEKAAIQRSKNLQKARTETVSIPSENSTSLGGPTVETVKK